MNNSEQKIIFGIAEMHGDVELYPNGMPMDRKTYDNLIENLPLSKDLLKFTNLDPDQIIQDYKNGLRTNMPLRLSRNHVELGHQLNFKKMHLDDIGSSASYVFPVDLYTYIMKLYCAEPQLMYIPERVVSDARSGQAKILFFDSREGHGKNVSEIIPFFYALSNYYDLPWHAIAFQDNNVATPEMHKHSPFRGFYYCWFEKNFIPIKQSMELYNSAEKYKHRFLCLNRRIANHRDHVANFLLKNPDIDARWSYILEDYNIYRDTNDEQITVNRVVYEIDQEFHDGVPKFLDLGGKLNENTNDIDLNKLITHGTAINLVTETFCHSSWQRPGTFISEKTFKPIVSGQPFLVLGDPHTLKQIREMGYLTYSDFWSEEYDSMEYPARLENVLEIVLELNGLSTGAFRDILIKTRDIRMHNILNNTRRRKNLIKEREFLAELRDWMYS